MRIIKNIFELLSEKQHSIKETVMSAWRNIQNVLTERDI